MGYQKNTLNGNNRINWVVSTFQQVGKTLENQTVISFQIPDDKEFMGSNSIVLQMYNNTGSCEKRFYFLDQTNAELEEVSKTGWYDADAYDANGGYTNDDYRGDETIPFGYGVIITSGEYDSDLTFAGQVVSTDTKTLSFDLYGNNRITWTGNMTPVSIALKDFAIPTNLGFQGSNSIQLEVYGITGSCERRYYFLDEETAELEEVAAPGWYDADAYDDNGGYTNDDLRNDKTLDPGQMVIITSGEQDTTLTIPTAL